MLNLNCPSCGMHFKVPIEALGSKGRCDRCPAKFIIDRNPSDMQLLEAGNPTPENAAGQKLCAQTATKLPPTEENKCVKIKKEKSTSRKSSPSFKRQTPENTAGAEEKKKSLLKPVIGLVLFAALLALSLIIPTDFKHKDNVATLTTQSVPDEHEHHQKWQAFTSTYCINCHGPDKQKGKFRLDTLALDNITLESYQAFKIILEQIEDGEMPPENKAQPANEELESICNLLENYLKEAKSSGKIAPPRVALKRLTRNQYSNTLSDLMHTDLSELPIKQILPDDRGNGEHYDVLDQDLKVSDLLMDHYLNIAEKTVNSATLDGQQPEKKISVFPENQRAFRFQGRGYNKEKNALLTAEAPVITRGNLFPHKGHYKLSFNVESLWRNTGKRKVWGYDSKYKHILNIQIKRADKWHTLGRYALNDHSKTNIEETLWVPQGSQLSLLFENGPGNLNSLLKTFKTPKEKIHEVQTPRVRIHEITVEGPIYEKWPIASHEQLYIKSPRDSLRELARRAFRRPVNDDELAPFFSLAEQKGIKMAVRAILCSPSFLYIYENQGQLDSYALANRLAYGLTNSMPDTSLTRLADSGELKDPQTYRKQLNRLIASEQFKRFVDDFVTQWLHLHKIDEMSPDSKKFRAFHKRGVKEAVLNEPKLFFRHLIEDNLPLSLLIDSDYTFMNDTLARFYGLKETEGTQFHKVSLNKLPGRGGLLGMAAILTASANGTDTSPVDRGIYVLDYILGKKVPEPPEEVDGTLPDLNGARTIKELFASHRTNPSCNQCHKDIDPIGFAMENFDAIGKWRTSYITRNQKLPIDPSGQLPNGKKFDDIKGLRQLLLENPEPVARNLIRQLLSYFTGRKMTAMDDEEVDRIFLEVKSNEYRMKDLLLTVLNSKIFLNK